MTWRDSDHWLSLSTVEPELVACHPLLNLNDARFHFPDGIEQTCWTSRLEASIDLHIVCINMVGTAMLPDNSSEWLAVDGKQQRSQNLSLWDSHNEWFRLRE